MDAKVPRSEHETPPLVVRGAEVVAVPGLAEAPGYGGLVEAVKDARETSLAMSISGRAGFARATV